METLIYFLVGIGLGGGVAALIARERFRRASRRREEELASTAHDLRTPISSIAAFSEILEEENDPAERQKFLGIIRTEAERLDRLVGDRLVGGNGRTADGSGVVMEARAAAIGKVLVVDDDRFIVEATKSLLQGAGFDVDGAGGGQEALERVRQRPPGVILLDLAMPAMGGEEALRRLKDDPATRDIPVIVTTGDARARTPRGAVGLLVKPIRREALIEAIARVMPGGGNR